MNDPEISSRPPLTPAELFSIAITDWFRFLATGLKRKVIEDQPVTIDHNKLNRHSLQELTSLRADRSVIRAYSAAAEVCKGAELKWLSYLNGVTKAWALAPSAEAAYAITTLNNNFLQHSGADAVKVIRHGYGSATNTYWGLVAVIDKLFAAQGKPLPNRELQREMSLSARQFTLVLLSLHTEHLRQLDATLRGENPTRDFQPHLFCISGNQLLIKQSAALLKLPEVGTSIATGCPAATAKAEGHGTVVGRLLGMFEGTYLSMSR
jgi:hypothetical protein